MHTEKTSNCCVKGVETDTRDVVEALTLSWKARVLQIAGSSRATLTSPTPTTSHLLQNTLQREHELDRWNITAHQACKQGHQPEAESLLCTGPNSPTEWVEVTSCSVSAQLPAERRQLRARRASALVWIRVGPSHWTPGQEPA